MNMICTFFGHRDASDTIRPLLRETLTGLIERQDVRHFYVGNQGNFDAMARSVLAELQTTYEIRYEVVLAYMPQKTDPIFKNIPTVLPEGIEAVPRRFAIDRRNRWMIEHSDIVVAYVTRSFGGAAKFRDIARKQKKTIIEIETHIK